MTEEEKAAALAAEKAKADLEASAQAEKDEAIAAAIEAEAVKDARITKLEEDLENYRKVAMKRLGKLEGDADFMGDSELSVAEQVKIALLNREIEIQKSVKDEENRKLVKEVAELRLALKNRPQNSIGGDSGTTVDVKDNVLTPTQIAELTAKAKRLKADPDKFIAEFKAKIVAKG